MTMECDICKMLVYITMQKYYDGFIFVEVFQCLDHFTKKFPLVNPD